MNQNIPSDITPALMLCPAFRVENGIITEVNSAASSFGIQTGVQINTLICVGSEEFSQFTEGRLDLTLMIDDTPISACAIPDSTGFIFCLDSPFTRPEQRALALSALHLREPLSNALISTTEISEDLSPAEKARLAHIRKNLQQLARMIYNMADLADYSKNANLSWRNAVAIFREVLEKAQTLLEKSGKQLLFSLPEQPFFCNLDEQMLRRGALNLLSNAAIFADGSDPIEATLVLNEQRLLFSVENTCSKQFDLERDLFSCYMREPNVEDGRNGIGLGLPIVNSVAYAHNGVVLMTQPESGRIRVTLSIRGNNTAPTNLRSPVHIPIERYGGWDQSLVELSSILSIELYEP